MRDYLDSQSAILLDGPSIWIELEYDDETDMFFVTADADDWINDCTLCTDDESDREIINYAKEACHKISGRYLTLRSLGE